MAPSVLREHVSDWFDINVDSPYMLMVATARECHRREMTSEEQKLFGIDKLKVSRSSVPAVTHVDYSARVQTVHLLLLLFRAVPPKQRRMMVCNL